MSMALTHKFPTYGTQLLLFGLYLAWPWAHSTLDLWQTSVW